MEKDLSCPRLLRHVPFIFSALTIQPFGLQSFRAMTQNFPPTIQVDEESHLGKTSSDSGPLGYRLGVGLTSSLLNLARGQRWPTTVELFKHMLGITVSSTFLGRPCCLQIQNMSGKTHPQPWSNDAMITWLTNHGSINWDASSPTNKWPALYRQ